MAIKTGLTRAAARRYLLTLEMLGCVRQNGAGFSLTPRILDLGFSYLSTVDVVDLALRQMEEVAKSLHETCSLAVLDGTEIVYIGRVPANRIMTINLVVGSRLPAHATSIGKVLLAYLSDEALDTYFATATLQRCTDRTLCTRAGAACGVEGSARARLGAERSGDRDRRADHRGAGVRPVDEGGGGDERLRPHLARLDRRAEEALPAGARRGGPGNVPRPRRQPLIGRPAMSSTVPVPAFDANDSPSFFERHRRRIGGLIALAAIYLVVAHLLPRPQNVSPAGWRITAIFLATIAGLMLQPLPGAALVLIGLMMFVLVGGLPMAEALSGFSSPSVWLVLGGDAHRARPARHRPGAPHRAAVRAAVRRQLARRAVLAGDERRDARLGHPVDHRARRQHHPADHAQHRRALRLASRPDGASASASS